MAQSTATVARRAWQFDNSYLRLPNVLYSEVELSPVKDPHVLIFNDHLAQELGLGFLKTAAQTPAVLSGSQAAAGSTAFAQAYAGHQFGGFSILGDGRALMIGEHITPDGRRIDVQIKGSGPTVYSRRGDGRATLAAMLREYVISEAMHALGIATTRSLAVVGTGEPVFRQTAQPGAVLTRIASSHLRVGTFQYAAARGDTDLLSQLLKYAIDRHYPQLLDAPNRALALLEQVVDVQASLIVQWMRVGFVHGVMNTDNMTISGQTIDYGPCAFMDAYDPATVFSSIDHQGRYAFGNQPGIAQWNLLRLAEAILPLIDPSQSRAIDLAKEVVGRFTEIYLARYELMMLNKLGIFAAQGPEDLVLANDLLAWMNEQKVDYTNLFRALSQGDVSPERIHGSGEFLDWYGRWQSRLAHQGQAMDRVFDFMKSVNPAYIPRNYLLEQALQAAENSGDLSLVHEMLAVVQTPYVEQTGRGRYADPGARDPGYRTFCGT
jgi:serine/tyrosine/threonine adenylyltransferase